MISFGPPYMFFILLSSDYFYKVYAVGLVSNVLLAFIKLMNLKERTNNFWLCDNNGKRRDHLNILR